jgi:hypothetical protein
MISLRHASLLTTAGWLAVLATGVLAFLALVGLRFQRRGSARFWTTPAAIALCLLPVGVGLAFAGLVVRQTLTGMALVGAGGQAAVAAGGAEALTPLLVGLFVLLALVASAFVMTAAGSSRATASSSGELAGWALLAVALFASALASLVVWLVLRLTSVLNGPGEDPQTLGARLTTALVGAFALIAVTLVLAPVGAFLSPRGASSVLIKLGSLASLAFCGLLGLGGLWATWQRSESLVATAMTGVPEDELPAPVSMAPELEARPEPPPPPPPPPAAAPAGSSTGEAGARSRTAVRETGNRAPARVAAVRVGGAIREPRKIRNVSPAYPDIARTSRARRVCRES